ncbi:hypothetical protein HK100_010901 [Physocladia obscura]|uniref:Uncharacterized protein n=1 Tax=Physocladia obscura TaxID=109957 RepID=A0AAD5T3A9_9FUNG|nr:hypothetical protein HK100_010901 [Physocladia obscura]
MLSLASNTSHEFDSSTSRVRSHSTSAIATNGTNWNYRAYVPTVPCANKIVQLKWDQHVQKTHREKLERVASTEVKITSPVTYPSLTGRSKKQRDIKDNAKRVDAENKILLDRIKRQVAAVQPKKTRSKSAQPDSVLRKNGLNGPYKRDLNNETEKGNMLFLQRIEASSPFYNSNSFKKDRIATLKHLQNISRFPARYLQELENYGSLKSIIKSKRELSKSRDTNIEDYNCDNPPKHMKKPYLIKRSNDGILIPPKYSPKVPLIPRVAKITPKCNTFDLKTDKNSKEPRNSIVIVPRVALIAQQKQKERREKEAMMSQKTCSSHKDLTHIYSAKATSFEFENEFPGDEELFIPNGYWQLTPFGTSLTEVSDETRKENKFANKFTTVDENALAKSIISGSAISSFVVLKETKLRNFCMSFGIEFQWIDISFNIQNVNSRAIQKVQRWCLNESLQDSIAFNQIAFFDCTKYGDQELPTKIDASVFEQLLQQAKFISLQNFNVSGLDSAESLMKKWYVLDENWIPGQWVLKSFNNSSTDWSNENIVLQKIMKDIAIQLGRRGILEPASVQRFVQSRFQEEILVGIVKQSRKGDWFKSLLCATYKDITSSLSKEDSRLISKLQEYLYNSVPKENQFEDGILAVAENMPETNKLNQEIVRHLNFFKSRAKDHCLREHLIEKLVGYMNRNENFTLPPLLVFAESGMGKTSVIGKSLQRLVKNFELQPQNIRQNMNSSQQPTGNKKTSNCSSNSLNSNCTSAGGAFGTLDTVTMNCVIVARVAGLTEDSSTSYNLMKSITDQICSAYSIKRSNSTEVLIGIFSEVLKVATAEKPLIIIVSKIENIFQHSTTGSMYPNISWLLDDIPPFVRIVLSSSDHQTINFISERIKLRAPSVLSAQSKNVPLPSDQELKNVHESFFLKIGQLIHPVLKSSIKRLSDVQGRRLQSSQLEAIKSAFLTCESVNGVIPIRMLKLIHNLSKDWTSWDLVDSFCFPKTVSQALTNLLEKLEEIHGEEKVKLLFSLLVSSKDGLTQSELSDLFKMSSTYENWNERKIRELPNSLLLQKNWKELEILFSDIEFLTGILHTKGVLVTCCDLNEIIAAYASEKCALI